MSLNLDWAPEAWQQAPAVPAWTKYFSQVNPNATVLEADIYSCAHSGQKAWGASFDDGPSPYTPALVDELTRLGAHVTFYTVGSVALSHPAEMQHAFDAGNEIQLHTWSHPKLTTISDDEIVAEFVYSAKAMYEILGVVPKYFRPPYGACDDRVRRVAASMGLTPVAWSADTNDWQFVDQGQAVMDTAVLGSFSNWIAQGRVDEISLEHDIKFDAAEAGKKGIGMLRESGYDVMTVAECIGDADPYGNAVLKAFFESGQFDNKEEAVLGGTTATSASACSAAAVSTATVSDASSTTLPTVTPVSSIPSQPEELLPGNDFSTTGAARILGMSATILISFLFI
ncbi:chitin deacetylase [Podochytrium sp. JEL0797]|nr:chitin deacetylase [Podochytrium sp. JEL0797]